MQNKTEAQDAVLPDIYISIDGSCQRRGYASLNGFVAALSMGTSKIVELWPSDAVLCSVLVRKII